MLHADDWPVCWCALSPGCGHLWDQRHCPAAPVLKDDCPGREVLDQVGLADIKLDFVLVACLEGGELHAHTAGVKAMPPLEAAGFLRWVADELELRQ